MCIRDSGKVLDTLTTDKNGHAESKELPICTYNEDGSFKEDIHYTVAVSYTHLKNLSAAKSSWAQEATSFI